MSSFFTLPASQRKRKREDRVGGPAIKKRGVTARSEAQGAERGRKDKDKDDESISGSESDGEGSIAASDEESGSSSDEGETGAERRLRLAEQYLENIREEVDEVGFDAAEIDRDLIAERLKEDVDESKGRAFRRIASQLNISSASHSHFRANTDSMTAIAVHSPYVFTVSKDKTLIKWRLPPSPPSAATLNSSAPDSNIPIRKKPQKLKWTRGLRPAADEGEKQGHTGNILTLAVSPSGQFLATGGADHKLIIWDAETLTPLKTFTQHRDVISGLSFTPRASRSGSGEQLFSASFDRTIKTWSIAAEGHAYVETLFGHQDHVVTVASMTTDQCVSVGARDRTARLWKVMDETQLVFRAGGLSKASQYVSSSIDCVAVIPPAHFVTGSDSGAISLWSVHKKKPLHTIYEAHGLDPLPPLDDLSPENDALVRMRNTKNMRRNPRWITALTSLPGTDIILSGSWDGWIRAWEVSEDKRRLRPLGCVGDINNNINLNLEQPLSNGSFPVGEVNIQEAQDQNGKTDNPPPLRGIVNDISVFERRGIDSDKKHPRSKDKATGASGSEHRSICIVAAVGKEHRLGRWKVFNSNDSQNNGNGEVGGRNGAAVFEIPFLSQD
ncbi:pre-rRNA processing protein [Myotisia sp. PD_48]|nr:pre-rRNA processing protein [Myotisia sp. PD_48]